MFFQLFFGDIGHHGKNHTVRGEAFGHEAAEHFRRDFFHGSGGAQDGRFQGRTLEQQAFKAVVDVFGRVVFVGDDLIQDHAALRLDFLVREGGFQGQFEQQPGGFAQVFLQHCGVQDNLFLGGVGVQFAAQAVQVAANDGSALVGGSAEQGVFHKMGYAGRKAGFVPCAAADGEGAIRHGAPALPDGVAYAGCREAAFHRFRARRLRSSTRNPSPNLGVILCRWM